MAVLTQMTVFILGLCSVVTAVQQSCTPGDAHLANSTEENQGILEICTNSSQWSTVCSSWFGCNEAKVACRQAGYDGVLNRYNNYTSWRLKKPQTGFYSCFGTETTLSNCRKRVGLTLQYNCGNNAVGLRCIKIPEPNCKTENAVRLFGGESKAEGQLQICRNKRWRDVCDRQRYSDSLAIGYVACRQLGYTGTYITTTHSRHYYNSSFQPDLYSSVRCYARTYSSISFCSITESDCYYCKGQEVAIQCKHEKTDCKNRDLRLVGGRNKREGWVETCNNGIWGKVSANAEGRAIDVICSTLGYNETGAILRSGWYANRYYTSTQSPFVAKYINCCDRDKSFQTCDIHWAKPSDRLSSNSYLAVQCIDGCTHNAMRLTGGNTTDEGIVELCVSGTWSMIGLNQWDDVDANVVCQRLYPDKKYAYAIATNSTEFASQTHYPTYDNVRCYGGEQSLAYCSKSGVSLNVYTGPVAAVHCHPVCDCS